MDWTSPTAQLFTRGAEDDSVRTLSKKMIFLSLSVKGLGVCLQRSRLQDECALLLRGLVLENLLPFVDRDIVLCTDSPWLHSREDISSDGLFTPLWGTVIPHLCPFCSLSGCCTLCLCGHRCSFFWCTRNKSGCGMGNGGGFLEF